MKSFGILLCSMFLSALLLVSCDKGITVKGENGKKYTTYQAACRDNDYNAAHEFLDLMKKKADKPTKKNWFTGEWNSSDVRADKKAYHEAVDYVYTQEMMFLVSDGSESAINRITYLMTEARSEFSNIKNADDVKQQAESLNNQCGRVVDLALSQGNVDLVKKIVPLCYSYIEASISEGLQD